MSSTLSPSWLTAWKAGDTLPHSARAEAEAAIPRLTEALQPAPAKAQAVAIGRLLDWAMDFGLVAVPTDDSGRREWSGRMSKRYREALEDLPADLITRAVEETMLTHRFRNMPLPADMRAVVAGELMARKGALGSLQVALRLNRFASPPVAPEDRPTAAQFAAFRRDLHIRRLPGSETVEAGEPPPPADARVDRGEAA